MMLIAGLQNYNASLGVPLKKKKRNSNQKSAQDPYKKMDIRGQEVLDTCFNRTVSLSIGFFLTWEKLTCSKGIKMNNLDKSCLAFLRQQK